MNFSTILSWRLVHPWRNVSLWCTSFCLCISAVVLVTVRFQFVHCILSLSSAHAHPSQLCLWELQQRFLNLSSHSYTGTTITAHNAWTLGSLWGVLWFSCFTYSVYSSIYCSYSTIQKFEVSFFLTVWNWSSEAPPSNEPHTISRSPAERLIFLRLRWLCNGAGSVHL